MLAASGIEKTVVSARKQWKVADEKLKYYCDSPSWYSVKYGKEEYEALGRP